MDESGGGSCEQMWMVIHPEAVARIIEESLREDAWWIAARTGRYVVQGPTVWADCVRAACVLPKVDPSIEEMECIEALLRRRQEG